MMTMIIDHLFLSALVGLAVLVAVFLLAGFRRVPNNGAGIVEKRFTFKGSISARRESGWV